VFYRARVCPMH